MADKYACWWPFAAQTHETPNGIIQSYYCGAADRITAVKRMTDRAGLEAMLQIPELQKSVADAARRRMRQLGFVEVPA